jgi:hypothetical protein
MHRHRWWPTNAYNIASMMLDIKIKIQMKSLTRWWPTNAYNIASMMLDIKIKIQTKSLAGWWPTNKCIQHSIHDA